MIQFKNLIEEIALELALDRLCRDKQSIAAGITDPDEARVHMVNLWYKDISEPGIDYRMQCRRDAATALKSIIHLLGKDFGEIAKDENIILSDSRRPGSLGQARFDHGRLIADLILKRVVDIDTEISEYIAKL